MDTTYRAIDNNQPALIRWTGGLSQWFRHDESTASYVRLRWQWALLGRI